MEIIKQGNIEQTVPKYKTTCSKCKCEFAFDRHECTFDQRSLTTWVNCPTCGQYIKVE